MHRSKEVLNQFAKIAAESYLRQVLTGMILSGEQDRYQLE